MDKDSHAAGAVTHRFVRVLGICVLAAIASLVLADRVNATYLHSDVAGDYLDRGWYYLLDDGQYYYLDRGQYNLLGELDYLLGHPCYPKLFERDLDQAVGFTNRVNTGWFSIGGGQVPISEYVVWSYHFNAGDYIDRVRYHYLDKGRYYYLDEVQYSWLGGLGYMFERPHYQRQYDWGFYQSVGQCPIPTEALQFWQRGGYFSKALRVGMSPLKKEKMLAALILSLVPNSNRVLDVFLIHA